MVLINNRAAAWLRAALTRLLLASFIWWVVSEGQSGALYAGAVAVAAAVAFSLYLAPPQRHRVRLRHLILFAGYFLGRSLIAGLDVGRRILHPALPVTPTLVRVPLKLPSGPPRWLLMQSLSLVPGTLSVAIDNDRLLLHCLNNADTAGDQVRDMETRISALFGLAPGVA